VVRSRPATGSSAASELSFLDPGGLWRAAIPKERIIGGVIFSANELVAPGIVVNNSTDRNMLLIGECDDRASERIERLRAALDQAGVQSPPELRIRETIWTKLIGNMSISVLCLLTGQTVKAAVQEPALRDVVPRLLKEAQAVARSCYPDVKRDTRGGAPADHKPSLLQDYELGRALEIDVLIRAPAAFARVAGLSTPMLDVVAALASLKARDKGLAQALSQSLRSS
jgi:2-dehydropantoate 2-reductase